MSMRVLVPVLLAACAAEPAPPPDAPGVADDPCGASGYAGLVGANVAAVTLPADLDHRIIGPDTVVTMDFVPERLNIEVTADGLIAGLRCG